MPLLNAAYTVRRHHHGDAVQIHILNNAQNGRCPEDCSYCTQAKTSEAGIEPYAIKSRDEVLAEAGRGPRGGGPPLLHGLLGARNPRPGGPTSWRITSGR